MDLQDKVEHTVNYVWDRNVPVNIDKILAHYNFVVKYVPNKLAIKDKRNYMVEINFS